MTKRCFSILFLFTLFLSCKGTQKSTSHNSNPYAFDFMEAEKISEVIEVAERGEKLIFMDIYTDWCMPCKIMDEDVFTDKRLAEFYNERFVSYKVNAEKDSGPIIAELYAVQGYPTLLFLDRSGKVILRKAGVAYSREMYELAEECLRLSETSSE